MTARQPSSSPVFQLSGLHLSDLNPALLASVRDLGGQVLTKSGLDPSCTHLVVGRLAKTEKVLLALAGGIWIVGTDFLEASVEDGCWAEEESFDVGVRADSGPFQVAPQKIRKRRALEGGAFAKLSALVLLDEMHKRDVYERILRCGGAQVVKWTWDVLSSVTNSESQLLIFSEPDVLLDRRVKLADLSVYSYLFISESLIKETPLTMFSFNLENEGIRMIHKQYKADCKLKLSQTASIDRNNSMSWCPNNVTDVFNRKRQASLSLESASKRSLCDSICSDTSSSPRKIIVRKSKLPSSTSTTSSTSSGISRSQSASLTEGNVIASVDSVRVASEKGVARHLSLYGSNVVDYVPKSMYQQLEDEDLVPQEHFFNHVLETYIHCNYDDESGRSAMWLWAISFLRDSCSKTVHPSLKMFRTLLYDGILTQANDVVCHAVGTYLNLLVEILYPPVTFKMCQYYQRAFSIKSREEVVVIDPFEHWNFMLMLIDACSKVSRSSYSSSNGLIALNVFTKMLEVNFHHWFNTTMKTGFTQSMPLVGQMLWTDNEPIAINSRVKKLLELTAICLNQSCSKFEKNILLITAITAQIICTVDKSKKQNTLKEDFVSHLGSSCRNLMKSELSRLNFGKICLLKPDWLSLQLTLDLMNKGAIRNDHMLSLRRILAQVRAPQEKIQNENVKPFTKATENQSCQGINITRKNKFGEVAIHLACKQGNLAKLEEILSIPTVDVNARDYNGWTALHEVCSNGHVDCLQALLKYSPRTSESLAKQGSRTKAVDILATGGEDEVTAFHEAVDANHLNVVDSFLTIVRQRTEVFPPLKQLLDCRTREGKTVFDLSRCAEMKKILLAHSELGIDDLYLTPQTLTRIDINEITRFGFCILLRKYCSEFSLHFIKEALKRSATGNKRRFSRGCAIAGHSNLVRYNVDRSEPTCATDLRSFNDLRLLDVFNMKYVDDIAKIVSLRLIKITNIVYGFRFSHLYISENPTKNRNAVLAKVDPS